MHLRVFPPLLVSSADGVEARQRSGEVGQLEVDGLGLLLRLGRDGALTRKSVNAGDWRWRASQCLCSAVVGRPESRSLAARPYCLKLALCRLLPTGSAECAMFRGR